MERDPYKFRSRARFVAFGDLILSSMSLCLCLISFTLLMRLSCMDNKTREDMIDKYNAKSSAATPFMEMDVGAIELHHDQIELQNAEIELRHTENELKNTGTELEHDENGLKHGESELKQAGSELQNTEGEPQDGESDLRHAGTGSELKHDESELHHGIKIDEMLMDDEEGGLSARPRYGKNRTHDGFFDPEFVKLVWMVWTLGMTMTIVHIVASIRLLNATQLGKDPLRAIELCRFWRLVSIFFIGILVFNFLSEFRQKPENILEVAFLTSLIVTRIFALYMVQLHVHELDMAILSTLPIRRIHLATSAHLPPMFGGPGGDLFAKFQVPLPPERQEGMPPKYEDVVKEPYKVNQEA